MIFLVVGLFWFWFCLVWVVFSCVLGAFIYVSVLGGARGRGESARASARPCSRPLRPDKRLLLAAAAAARQGKKKGFCLTLPTLGRPTMPACRPCATVDVLSIQGFLLRKGGGVIWLSGDGTPGRRRVHGHAPAVHDCVPFLGNSVGDDGARGFLRLVIVSCRIDRSKWRAFSRRARGGAKRGRRRHLSLITKEQAHTSIRAAQGSGGARPWARRSSAAAHAAAATRGPLWRGGEAAWPGVSL